MAGQKRLLHFPPFSLAILKMPFVQSWQVKLSQCDVSTYFHHGPSQLLKSCTCTAEVNLTDFIKTQQVRSIKVV